MKILQPQETELIGEWILDGTQVHGDESCDRIKWLVENIFQKVGYSKEYGAWETLYRDPSDGRFWVKTYPQSEIHGGGPPALKCISEEVANSEFKTEKA